MTANPFEVLRLAPSATEEEIVRQAGRLRQRATDEAARNAIRQAVQALTARAEDRLLFALWTHPAPRYRWPALEQLIAAFRRPPTPADVPTSCPPLDRDEFLNLLCVCAADELELPSLILESMSSTETAEEIDRQNAEALWQSLLYSPGA